MTKYGDITTYSSQTTLGCHCGAPMNGSDHCVECGCEAFEAYCEHKSAVAYAGEALAAAVAARREARSVAFLAERMEDTAQRVVTEARDAYDAACRRNA